MKRMVVTLAVVFSILVIAGCRQNSYKDIYKIYIYHKFIAEITPEYLIDLKNKELWKYSTGSFYSYVERDSNTENEGFEFVSNLSEDDVKTFLNTVMECGFVQWDGPYETDILDGHEWGITIHFADGTTNEIQGSNAYPETWDEMYEALQQLCDENILLHKSDWIKR